MAQATHVGLSPAISELDELVDHLTRSRARAGSAFAAEMFFFERVPALVARREQERAARDGSGALTHSSQLGMREVFAEIGAGLRLSEWQVARKASLAWSLTHQFYETLCQASCGEISPEQATLIADTGAVIGDDAVRRQYEAVGLDMAAEMTPGRLGPALAGLVTRLDPDGTAQRVRAAVARRKVTVRELEPGLARVIADVPTAQGVGIVNRLRDMATELHGQNTAEQAEAEAAAEGTAGAGAVSDAGANGAADPDATADTGQEAADPDGAAAAGNTDTDSDSGAGGPVCDERTHTQIMADIFCDLLLTSVPDGHGATGQARDALGAIRATVQVTLRASTLAGQTSGGSAVLGFGPVGDDTASGVPISVDRYRPSKRQRLFLQVRDVQCRFPGCRRPAQKCDIDHTRGHADGGPTGLCNLAHLCTRHHTLKHDTDWTVQQLPGGILIWTAPTGRTHTTRPPGTVRFGPPEPIPF
ncbi:hypothetical protein GCM10022240_19980 [Microbacterium kribbense]|uniref:DUF222 domain-containing protein n=1 Tax=Microbacterium kribbense TaxID=433645 RepID=A0ABP7GK40_9MICO